MEKDITPIIVALISTSGLIIVALINKKPTVEKKDTPIKQKRNTKQLPNQIYISETPIPLKSKIIFSFSLFSAIAVSLRELFWYDLLDYPVLYWLPTLLEVCCIILFIYLFIRGLSDKIEFNIDIVSTILCGLVVFIYLKANWL